MSNILLTGIATLDIINHVSSYPHENDEIRATRQDLRRGGNAANSAIVLSQFNHDISLSCSLANDSAAQFIQGDLESHSIQLLSEIHNNSATPTSYINLNSSNGSRTIVHYRNLKELSFKFFNLIPLDSFQWLHFEARNIQQTYLMMSKAKHYNNMISLEIEKTRLDADVICLIDFADILMLSKPFVLSQGFDNAKDCLEYFSNQFSDKIICCTWGSRGAWIIRNGVIYHSPAACKSKIIDTIGAGDTFNAALINALINKLSIKDALNAATKLASLKCTQSGLNNLIKPPGTIDES